MIEQATLDYDDMFAGLTPEILKNIFIRFYTMQDFFQFSNQPAPAQPSNMSSIIQTQKIQAKKITPVFMMYNRIIQQCIYDLYIMNKLINSKAKLVHSILDNGHNIAQKKNDSWVKFVEKECFQKIRVAYQLMPNFKKDVIKYAVLSISNLLLKLSINMSKVSVIPIQKFLNFECLNIPTLSVAFLQNLQYILFNSKSITEPGQKLNFMRQLPKITYIKLNRYKNNTDLELLEKSQYEFISSKVDQVVKNLQYIQIYEDSYDRIMPEYERTTKYPYFHRFDLGQIGGKNMKSPYNFQILQIMRQIIFPIIKQFKPDEIVYMQSYPNDTIVMNDQIRGLLLCQMAQQTTCNKMYVFKQMGQDKMSIKGYQDLLKTRSKQQITQQFAAVLNDEQKKICKAYYNRKLLIGLKQDKEATMAINKIKKIFINQLCYISLALIQKTSFDDARQKSNKQIFEPIFLRGIEKQLEKLAQNKQLSITGVKSKIDGVRMMRNFAQIKKNKNTQNGYKIISLVSKPNYFTTFYNLQKLCSEPLIAITEPGNIKNQFIYSEEDNIIVKYYPERILVILIKYDPQKDAIQMIFLSKGSQQKNFQILQQFYCESRQNYLEGATYVCSNDYLYRGFGKQKNPKDNIQTYNKNIHRIRINPQIGKFWQQVTTHAITAKPGEKQSKIQLEQKVYGYGIYDIDNKAVLMMGGYVDSYNEQRISKNIYHIKNSQLQTINKTNKVTNDSVCVSILGKTNKILYTTQKLKNLFLYPFVFGIPFFFGTATPKSSFVLNSNGNYMNLNHFGKIFTSSIKLSGIIIYNGIVAQNKLYISNDTEEAATSIFLAEVLQKCLVYYPHQINIKDNLCCVQSLEEGPIVLRADLASKAIEVLAEDVFEDDTWRKIKFI